jgi:urocanate hydratase
MEIDARAVDDLGTDAMRHADAGYSDAIASAKEQGLKLPMA